MRRTAIPAVLGLLLAPHADAQTTIVHLWPMGDRVPTGAVESGQSVGHRPMTAEAYTRSKPQP